MPAAGTRRAAMLLMGLDPSSAAELLKAARPDVVTEIVAEVAYLDAAGYRKNAASSEHVREFFGLLKKSRGGGTSGENLVKQLLETTLGRDKARDVLGRMGDMVQVRDPFLAVRATDVGDLAKALAGESPQVAALVLAELPAKKSGELLSLLDEKVRLEAVRGMAGGEEASADVRKRVADLVMSRLKAPGVKAAGRKDQQLRKVAVLLRGLGGDLRNNLLKSIVASDKSTGESIQRMMVTWDDIVSIADRSLQEALRGVESKKLALALLGAGKDIVKKLRTNMSERASQMLDEETSLLSSPKPEEIARAREDFLQDLRELNVNNMLSFVD